MSNCIFCKINKGEIPSPKVYEDEDFFIINDINPKAKKHYLMIQKHISPSSTYSKYYNRFCEKCQSKNDIGTRW